jgi:hypothetical protein
MKRISWITGTMQRGVFTSASSKRAWIRLIWSARFHGLPSKTRHGSLSSMYIQVKSYCNRTSFFHFSVHSKLVDMHLTVSPCLLFSFCNTSIGTATEIAELPGFYVRIIPSASSLFDVSKLNLSTRNNVRAYTKGNMLTLDSLKRSNPYLWFFSVGISY